MVLSRPARGGRRRGAFSERGDAAADEHVRQALDGGGGGGGKDDGGSTPRGGGTPLGACLYRRRPPPGATHGEPSTRRRARTVRAAPVCEAPPRSGWRLSVPASTGQQSPAGRAASRGVWSRARGHPRAPARHPGGTQWHRDVCHVYRCGRGGDHQKIGLRPAPSSSLTPTPPQRGHRDARQPRHQAKADDPWHSAAPLTCVQQRKPAARHCRRRHPPRPPRRGWPGGRRPPYLPRPPLSPRGVLLVAATPAGPTRAGADPAGRGSRPVRLRGSMRRRAAPHAAVQRSEPSRPGRRLAARRREGVAIAVPARVLRTRSRTVALPDLCTARTRCESVGPVCQRGGHKGWQSAGDGYCLCQAG